ncbi:MAG TPA: 3-dehydroquinate synthase [Pirellulales bacterium]|nr:3-dehydroquinate synthase [Pirellulales bacterium]
MSASLFGPPSEQPAVFVPLGERSYTIEIGTGTLDRTARFLLERRRARHAVILTDEHVEEPHAAEVVASLVEQKFDVDLVVIESGELSKSVETAQELWQKLLDLGADRQTVVIAVGGGVIGDLAGFVAASYARGIPFLQIPTTLLAQVDSSVGGKVGVNLPGAKNMVGAFWQPLGVLIDTDVLATLPDREYRSGLAEVVKYGVILDAEFFEFLESHLGELNRRDAATLRRVVARSCQLKAWVVSQDEREETGLRAVLNYGHTFAHALEALGGYSGLLHGEAVAIGMLCASRLAEGLGRIDAALTLRQRQLLAALRLPVAVPPQFDAGALVRAMSHDKKAEQGRLRFVLPKRLGQVELVGNVPEAAVFAALEAGDEQATG